MANTTNPRRNAEGYSDPTAYEALKNIEREEDERFHRLLLCLADLGESPLLKKFLSVYGQFS